jgi:signal transduction histidine kinase
MRSALSTRAATVLALGVCVVDLVAITVPLLLDTRLQDRGVTEMPGAHDPIAWILVLTVVSAGVVGALIVHRESRHAVGWCFLALATAMALTAPADSWFAWSTLVQPAEIGGSPLAARAADGVWMLWFPPVALALMLTPTGRFTSRWWRFVGWTVAICGIVGFLAALVRDTPLEAPYDAATPHVVAGLSPVASVIAVVAAMNMSLGLLLSPVALVLRFRRATGEERQRLLWLVLAVVPLPVFVVTAWVASYYDLDWLTLVATFGFVTLVPITAGLSVLRYRLYDVERVVTTTLTYALLSSSLVAVYIGIVWLGARLSPDLAPSPVAVSTTGAVAAAVLAGPLRRGLQERIDRHFNRRAFDAARVLRRGLAVDRAGIDVQALLGEALNDPSLRVTYPGGVDSSGAVVPPIQEPVEIFRAGRVVARIGFDATRAERVTVARLGDIAAAELDNTALRTDLARQAGELEASRRRISDASLTERRRIERDLHDGAQQRLLGAAAQLQAALMNGHPERMRTALEAGVSECRTTVVELRDLANGLHPSLLRDGGLASALGDLQSRHPVSVQIEDPTRRWPAAVEATAWFVASEGVANAVKHASGSAVDICVAGGPDVLTVRVSDTGNGGADPHGNGLRGLRDRVESQGGTLRIDTRPEGGTTLEAVIPCGS